MPHGNTDQNDLIPIGPFDNPSETDVVLSFLQSNGIPAICGGLYNPKAPKQVLVPRSDAEEALRLVADVRNSSPPSAPESTRSANEPWPILTGLTWLLAIGFAFFVLLEAGRVIYGIAMRFVR